MTALLPINSFLSSLSPLRPSDLHSNLLEALEAVLLLDMHLNDLLVEGK